MNQPIEVAERRGGSAVVVEPLPAPPEPSALEQLRSRGRMRYGLALLGPAFVAAVAYVDPGNFATNVAAGSKYGYLLLWVVVAANLMAMLIQYLSAKVGIATGPQPARAVPRALPPPTSIGLWIQAELIAMATDLAEFVGAAIALNLLFGVPLFVAGLITAVIAFAILGLQTRGYRRFETTIAGLLGVILLGFLYEVVKAGPDASGAAARPRARFRGHRQRAARHGHPRRDRDAARDLPALRVDAGRASSPATTPSAASCCASSASTSGWRWGSRAWSTSRCSSSPPPCSTGCSDIDSIDGAYHGFRDQVGDGAAIAFGVALLASGLSSSSVGTYAGQVVMQGFIRRSVPLLRPPPDHDAARPGRAGDRGQRDRRARDQPGGALVRHPVRAGAAGAAHAPGRRDGQPAQHARPRRSWRAWWR